MQRTPGVVIFSSAHTVEGHKGVDNHKRVSNTSVSAIWCVEFLAGAVANGRIGIDNGMFPLIFVRQLGG